MKHRSFIGLACVVFALVLLCNVVQAQAPVEKTVIVFGAKINYLEAGDRTKPAVILLHGLGGSVGNWQLTIPSLSAQYHVFAIDQVGFGKSDKPFLQYRVETYVDFLDKFMHEVKINRASLIGSSMGGWIAALMTIRYPHRVGKLVLADSLGIFRRNTREADIYQLNNSTRKGVSEQMRKMFASPSLNANPALVDQILSARVTSGDGYTISSLIESIRRGEDQLNNQLVHIKNSTLIIWGKQDRLTPVADAYSFHRGIKGSKLIIFDQCGHAPQFEKAADFNNQVMNFLSSQ